MVFKKSLSVTFRVILGGGIARDAQCDETIDHATRVGAAVAVVAEEDVACLRELVRAEAMIERGPQSIGLGQVSVQVVDQHGDIGRERVAGVRGGSAYGGRRVSDLRMLKFFREE